MSDETATLRPTKLGDDHFKCDVVIVNEMGMHARPASLFVGIAKNYPCEVWIVTKAIRVSGKSILQLLSLSAEAGTKMTVETKGALAEQAILELCELIRNGFGDASSHSNL